MHTIFVGASLVTVLMSGAACVAAIQSKLSRPQLMLVLFNIFTLLLNIAYLLGAKATNLTELKLANELEYIFGDVALFAFALFVFAWCRVKMPQWLLALLSAFFLTAAVLELTCEYHDLYAKVTAYTTDGVFCWPTLKLGAFNAIMTVFQVCLYLLLLAVFLRNYAKLESPRERRLNRLLIFAGVIPILTSVTAATGLFTRFDLYRIGNILTMGILTYCVKKEKMFDVLQSAFERVVVNAVEPILILDNNKKLLFSNSSAKNKLGDLKVGDALPEDAIKLFENGKDIIVVGDKQYQCDAVPLMDGDVLRGHLAIATDVSALYKLKVMLEAENRRIASDLKFAATIQSSALPGVFPPWPNRRDVTIFASMRPAKEVGGDFYDFFLVNDSHMGAVIADVSGKGVPAALFMMKAKTCIKDKMMAGLTPDAALSAANNTLCENNEAMMFVTVWAILVDLHTGEATFANAGHNPPMIRRSGGCWETIKSRPNIVLGDTPGIRYRSNTLSFGVGDTLFLYTDGLVEAMNTERKLYGEARMIKALEQNAALPPQALLPALVAEVDDFAGEAPQFDDITMLALRVDQLARTFVVRGELASVALVADFIETWLKDIRCPSKAAQAIMTVQDEIFSNIARYAFKDVPGGGEATVELFLEENFAVLRMSDSGVPFNPLDRTHRKRTAADLDSAGGEGIYIVRRLMDAYDYAYAEDRNTFTVKKRLWPDVQASGC